MLSLLQIGNTTAGNGTTVLPTLPPITLANAFGDLTSTLILITLMIAITVRTYPEYIEKLMKGEITSFNPKYIATAVFSFVVSLPIAMGLMPEGSKIFLAYFGDWGLAGALIMVGVFGYGLNHGVNKATSLLGHFFTTKEEDKKGEGEVTSNTEGRHEI
jgi:hypothetical protein